MKASITRSVCSPRSASPLVLALACVSLTSACSGEYPLGSASSSLDLAAVEPNTASEAGSIPDATLPATLAQHSFSITVDDFALPGTLGPVGDMDGDGYGDTAQSSWDFATGATWVHIRYGGPRPRDMVEALAFDRDGAYLALEPDNLALYYTVSAAGDVDGDGFSDMLLKSSDCTVTDPASASGVYLVYGGPERFEGTIPLASVSSHFAGPVYPDAPLEGVVSCNAIGHAFGAGDLDGDGIDDIVLAFGPQIAADDSVSYANGEGAHVLYGSPERFPAEVPIGASDAVFRVDGVSLNAYTLGDVTGDGLADLYLGPEFASYYDEPAYLIAGSGERWSGSLDIPTIGTPLPGVWIDSLDKLYGPRDIDGDGVDDLLLTDQNFTSHLFYGRQGLFAEGFDFADSDAQMPLNGRSVYIQSPGDLDGDGDDDLLDQFNLSSALPMPMDIALLSGSRDRLAGEVAFPEEQVMAAFPDGRFPESSQRYLKYTIPAGDLDADGADDVFLLSEIRYNVQESSYEASGPQMHVVYGTKATLADDPR